MKKIFFLLLFTSMLGKNAMATENEKATFAGGCFWCMESEFAEMEGVIETTVGYTGGDSNAPTYQSMGNHVEAIEIEFDPTKLAYEKLLTIFWENIDPLDDRGQFADRGSHYLTAIFVHNDAQRAAAQASKAQVQERFKEATVATSILPAKPFYAAEEYHQDYYKKNPERYKRYKYGSGRPARLQKLWGEDKQ